MNHPVCPGPLAEAERAPETSASEGVAAGGSGTYVSPSEHSATSKGPCDQGLRRPHLPSAPGRHVVGTGRANRGRAIDASGTAGAWSAARRFEVR